MGYALVTSISAVLGENGGTSGSIDTTGADLLVVRVSGYDLGAPGVSDSKSNIWVPLTLAINSFYGSQIYYSLNPTVGSGHTFTFTDGGSYSLIDVLAFSGSDLTDPFDVENTGTTGGASTLQPGSVTPSASGALIVTGIIHDKSSYTIDSGFTEAFDTAYSAGVNMGGGTAYLIQGSASAVNPTFTLPSSGIASAVIAAFLPAAGGGDSVLPLVACDMRNMCDMIGMRG